MVRRQQAADRAVRPRLRSPGRPYPRKDVERAFWQRIAEGLTSEDAAVAVGVSGPVAADVFPVYESHHVTLRRRVGSHPFGERKHDS